MRLVPLATSTVEQVLLDVGEKVGHKNASYASKDEKEAGCVFQGAGL